MKAAGGLFLGVDGGGTRTLAALGDDQGRVLGRGRGGPSNYQVVGLRLATVAIREAAAGALCAARSTAAEEAEEAGTVREGAEPAAGAAGAAGGGTAVPGAAAGAGAAAKAIPLRVAFFALAGVNRPQDARTLHTVLAAAFPRTEVAVDNDSAAALAGAAGGQPGVVIIAGTGSIAFGINRRGGRRRAGGWGPLLGDEGSGYDIGRRALQAVARAHDGRGPATGLSALLLGRLGLEHPEDLYSRVYLEGMERHEVAALVPTVVEAARAGDGVARGLLHQAGRELGLSAQKVISGLGMQDDEFPVACSGGVFKSGRLVTGPLERAVKAAAPGAHLVQPLCPPVAGALLLAIRTARPDFDLPGSWTGEFEDLLGQGE